jgi:hypothetical protein
MIHIVRFSEYFNLGKQQASLDFVDIDTVNDVSVFLEPGAIRQLPDDWGAQCVTMLTTFFDSVLDALRHDDSSRLDDLLVGPLGEPDENHLGWSTGPASRGRAVGPGRARIIIDNLQRSRAATSGLLQDLEDTALFVRWIGPDIISDITTNVCKGMLISYTQSVAEAYDINLEEVPSGPVWDPANQEWESGFTQLPTADRGKVLLVPKILVRYQPHLSQDEYYRSYLIPRIASEVFDAPGGRGLIRLLKSGEPRVSMTKLQKQYPNNKQVVTDESVSRPEVFAAYKEHKRAVGTDPLSHVDLHSALDVEKPDFGALLDSVVGIPPGQEGATKYHRAVEALLTAMFYPALSDPKIEDPIHEGRKRIDIRYTNTARQGFFRWLRLHSIPCTYIAVECKNYQSDPANPELDQISSRFSPLRGNVGILVCRSFKDRELFVRRCRDTALDHRGFVLPLDDSDLRALVDETKLEFDPIQPQLPGFGLLKDLFDRLIS